jgi:hypothetical protein
LTSPLSCRIIRAQLTRQTLKADDNPQGDVTDAAPPIVATFELQDLDGTVRIDLSTVISIAKPTSSNAPGIVITLNKKSGYQEVKCTVKGDIASVIASFAATASELPQLMKTQ